MKKMKMKESEEKLKNMRKKESEEKVDRAGAETSEESLSVTDSTDEMDPIENFHGPIEYDE